MKHDNAFLQQPKSAWPNIEKAKSAGEKNPQFDRFYISCGVYIWEHVYVCFEMIYCTLTFLRKSELIPHF